MLFKGITRNKKKLHVLLLVQRIYVDIVKTFLICEVLIQKRVPCMQEVSMQIVEPDSNVI